MNSQQSTLKQFQKQDLSILKGMPSLLGNLIQLRFSKQWPESRYLPQLKNDKLENQEMQFENFDLGNIFQVGKKHLRQHLSFELKQVMKVSQCPHNGSKHYAKNMCSACYHQMRKKDKETICGHNDRTVFARGMCSSCYYHLSQAYKKRKH